MKSTLVFTEHLDLPQCKNLRSFFICFVAIVRVRVSCVDFSTSLIIHQVKTKKVISVKEVCIPGLN